jgi:hypothetical protein
MEYFGDQIALDGRDADGGVVKGEITYITLLGQPNAFANARKMI